MMIPKRSAGLLLHITSLPSRFGIGDLGPAAYTFADTLQQAGQRFWQILPLNPTEIGSGNSPYSSHSAFAGNPLLISPELLVEDGLLQPEDLYNTPEFPETYVDFAQVVPFKYELLQKAYQNYTLTIAETLQQAHKAFQHEHHAWLPDFVLFVVFKKHFGHKSWVEWPEEIKQRQPEAMHTLAQQLAEDIAREDFLQFIFYRQWEKLKEYCQLKNISFFGDMPFYVSHDSADVWANPAYFKLDEVGNPTSLSGVPPDFFSSTGQLWGTPVFNWDALANHNYDWWVRRITHNLRLFGLLRLDHFRAFSAYWEVPAGEYTAMNGTWKPSPGSAILSRVRQQYPDMAIVAEDLGDIDQPVRDLIKEFDLPGMLVLIFAFESGEHTAEGSFMPHNHTKNSIVYTGTHDNKTVKAWYEGANENDRNLLCDYSYHAVTDDNVHQVMGRLALASVAQLAVLPVQDVLGLGAAATMNKPSTSSGNWAWRLCPGQFGTHEAQELYKLVKLYGRL